MDYGPHSSLVEEVIESITRGCVLRPAARIQGPDALIVTDLEDAKQYAWYRTIGDEDGPTWTNLREEQIAPFHAVPYERPELRPAYDAVEALQERIYELLTQTIPAQFLQLIDDLGGELRHCALNRALYGLVEDSFWERVWQVYRQGAWPCGWEGEYPAGRMIIYQPPAA